MWRHIQLNTCPQPQSFLDFLSSYTTSHIYSCCCTTLLFSISVACHGLGQVNKLWYIHAHPEYRRNQIYMNMINNAERQSLCELKSIDSRTGGDWKSRWISILHFRESRYNSAVCNMYIWLHLYSGWAWMYQSLFTWPSRHGMPLKLKNRSVVQQHE